MRRILVVDDSAINRKMLREMLSSDYEIVEAADGEAALDILRRDYKSISAVLLDIILPGIDGYGVLRRIRGDRRLSRLPVIMITASDDEAARAKSLSLSANDFVRKPYSAEILRHCLQNNITLSEAAPVHARRDAREHLRPARKPQVSLRAVVVFSLLAALVISLCVRHLDIQGDLKKTCRNVAVDFSEIMDSYRHSFRMFELLLQQEIENAEDPDEIEAFLKAQDRRLLDTAAVLKSACGASEDNYFLCRYGGDEFLLAARVEDVTALDRMRALITEGFKRKNQTSVTAYALEASMGAACGICRDKKSMESLLTLADQVMYDDKRDIEQDGIV